MEGAGPFTGRHQRHAHTRVGPLRLWCGPRSPAWRLLSDPRQGICPLWTSATFHKLGLEVLYLYEGKNRIPFCLWIWEQRSSSAPRPPLGLEICNVLAFFWEGAVPY